MMAELARLVAAYPPRFRPVSPPDPLGNAGGLSGAELWKFDAPAGRLVARAWPRETDPENLGRVHGWLGSLRDLEIVPGPIAGLDGRTFRSVAGRFWEIAPWKAGIADLRRPPDIARFRAALAALAAVHQRLAPLGSFGPSPGLAARLREIESLRFGGLESLERSIRSAGPSEERILALQWLTSARGLLDRVSGIVRTAAIRPIPLQPILRDARPDHYLFEDDRLTGLVDFGAMGIDTVAADLARLLPDWFGADPSSRSEARSAYESVRPLIGSELELIPAFEASTSLLIGGHWARWRFVEDRRFDSPSAVLDGLRRGLDRLGDLVTIPNGK